MHRSILGALHDAEVSHRSPATNRREYSHWVVKPYESKIMIGMLSPYWCLSDLCRFQCYLYKIKSQNSLKTAKNEEI